MTDKIVKLGFCRDCRKNVVHRHRTRTAFGRIVASLIGDRLTAFRIGRWYCPVCDRRSWLLPLPRDDAPDNQPADETGAELARAGNLVHERLSLVARQDRSRRFTEKFRDSIVERLMSGSATLPQLRDELNVTETDLLSWIADKFDRQSHQIERLTELLETMAERAELLSPRVVSSKPE